ncbi:nitroreductase [Streptomyces sp. AVP053U2]|uniref:nitroreductase family protein n=1 Tax=Streptomyces sp. AVP053U2 TaxID=1737066 RepID=UPI00073AF974|nr:nitroreductase [Streptomyces sp. AVP053U2]ODA71623.1 putative NAD(P)H nitroreductase YdjA [Streptomyces sp. AVP053U2]
MTLPPTSVLNAVLTRRSAPRLAEPVPDPAELARLVQAAATAPDHGRLRPWRLVAVSGDERARHGDVLAEAADTPEQARRAAAKPLRAPLLLTIVHRPVPDHPKVPEWEQLAATTGMVTTLSLLLHSHGFASIWRTGAAIQAPQVHKYLGIDDDEQLLGWLYVGTRCASDAADRRPLDTLPRITWHTTGT